MPIQFIKKNKPVLPDIRAHLHRHLAGYQPGRPANTLHASDITRQDPEFCPREAVIRAMQKKVPDEFITTADVLTFDLGNQIAENVIQWYADMDMAVGDWKCLHCGVMYRFCKRPANCTTKGCGHRLFKYEEIRLTSPVTTASGGIDLLLDIGVGKHVMVEHKTMKSEDFKKLVTPLAEHKLRTALYLKIASEAVDDPRTAMLHKSEAYIMYTTKGGWGSIEPKIKEWNVIDGQYSPFKLFIQSRDDVLVTPYDSRAILFKEWRDGGPVPPRTCLNTFEPRAKNCGQMVKCFSGKLE